MRSATAPINQIASQVVRDLTRQVGRTQAELAEFLEIGQPALSLRFHRGYAWPLSELVALSHWLGRDVLRVIAEKWSERQTQRSAS